MEAGTKTRILAAARKNTDRFVNLPSLLKVMGLEFDDRCVMLATLKDSGLHVWLLNESQQHLIYLSERNESEIQGYCWQ